MGWRTVTLRSELHIRRAAYTAAAESLAALQQVPDADLERARDLVLGLLWRLGRGEDVDDDDFPAGRTTSDFGS